MKEILLSGGKYATLVDDQDYDYLSQFKWHITQFRRKTDNTLVHYVVRRVDPLLHGVTILRMHTEIMKPDNGFLVDHRDGEGLHNWRANLRICDHFQNGCNRPPTGGCVFKGVKFTGVNWRANLRVYAKRLWLGTFATDALAAEAYDCAAIVGHGEFAWLNFLDKDYSAVYRAYDEWMREGMLDVKGGDPLRSRGVIVPDPNTGQLPETFIENTVRWVGSTLKANKPDYASMAPYPQGYKPPRAARATTLQSLKPALIGTTAYGTDRWIGDIRAGGLAYYLGIFNTQIECAEAYDRACLLLKVDRKRNFPEKPFLDMVGNETEWFKKLRLDKPHSRKGAAHA